jgi:hypothetical protein
VSFADGGMNNQFGKKNYASSKNDGDTTGKSAFTRQDGAR